MGNLGFETTVEDIREMFDAHQKAAGTWAPKVKGAEGVDEEAKEGEKEKDPDRDDDDEDDEASEAESEEAAEGSASEDDGEAKTKKPRTKPEKGPKDLSKAKDAGIRKVRLGTFEDTGKCKGFVSLSSSLRTPPS